MGYPSKLSGLFVKFVTVPSGFLRQISYCSPGKMHEYTPGSAPTPKTYTGVAVGTGVVVGVGVAVRVGVAVGVAVGVLLGVVVSVAVAVGVLVGDGVFVAVSLAAVLVGT